MGFFVYEGKMEKYLIIVVCLSLRVFPSPAIAETKTFLKEYTYQASEFDSKASSRILALEQVKRLLLEELGTYLISETEVKNFQMTKDQITVFTAGIVRAEVIDEKWDGKTYYLKAKITADPKDVSKAVDDHRQDKQKTKELEEVSRKANEQAKEMARLKKEPGVGQIDSSKLSDKVDTKTIQQYNSIVKKLSANDWLAKGLMLDSSKAAIEAYDKAIELNPEYAEAYFHRAKAYLDLSINYQKAIEDITKSIKLEPQSKRDGNYARLAEKYSIRAKAYLRIDDYGKAFNDLELAIILDWDVLSSRNWEKKKEDFEYLPNKFPNDYRVFMFRALSVRDFGADADLIEHGIADYKNALALNPNSAICKYLIGIAYDSLMYTPRTKSVSGISTIADDISWDTLVMFYTQALQSKPSQELRFKIYKTRSNVYWRAQKYEKSIEDISRAIEINPEYAEGYRDRAAAYHKLGKYRAAIEDYDIVIELKSAHVEFNERALIATMYIGRGDSYSELGEYTSAVKDYSTAIEIWTIELKTRWKNSYTFDYYNKRSKAYERLGKHQQAKKDFRDGVKLAFDKEDDYRYFQRGQELEGAEDQELKEMKLDNYKIAALLGHKKAQAYLKKRGIVW